MLTKENHLLKGDWEVDQSHVRRGSNQSRGTDRDMFQTKETLFVLPSWYQREHRELGDIATAGSMSADAELASRVK